MSSVTQRIIETNGIRMNIAEQGAGPLVVLCHGFPESWYSWRRQLGALAEAGYHAVAPDMRGYGLTESPTAADQFTILHLVGDIVGLVDALQAETAVVAGHDFGAPVAWHCALMRPDRFRAVVGLSVPYRPRSPVRPTTVMPQTDDGMLYQLYFQTPGVAEAELEQDVRRSIGRILYGGSGENPRAPDQLTMTPRGGGFVTHVPDPPSPLPWLTDADLDFYAAQFRRTGFRGGLNWYRNLDRSWELLAPFAGAAVGVPALFIAGDRDLVMHVTGMKERVANLRQIVPRLQQSIILPGCGHWTQQERPAEVNAAMIDFLHRLES